MEEILASIRRILKDEDPVAVAPPVDMDEDVLLLDQSMIAKPADVSSATTMPAGEHPATPLQSRAEPLHFSSEPVPLSGEMGTAARMMPEPVVDLPPLSAPPRAEPEPEFARDPAAAEPPPKPYQPTPPSFISPPAPEKLVFPEPQPLPPPEPEPFRPADAFFAAPPPPDPFRASTFSLAQVPYRMAPAAPERPAPSAPERLAPPTPEPTPVEPIMTNPQDSLEPPESLISDKTTDAAATSIGALVRSMSTEKSVAVTKSGSITIEDIVREEIRPLLKSWLDSHLPSLVERVVRAEIERVINRTVV